MTDDKQPDPVDDELRYPIETPSQVEAERDALREELAQAQETANDLEGRLHAKGREVVALKRMLAPDVIRDDTFDQYKGRIAALEAERDEARQRYVDKCNDALCVASERDDLQRRLQAVETERTMAVESWKTAREVVARQDKALSEKDAALAAAREALEAERASVQEQLDAAPDGHPSIDHYRAVRYILKRLAAALAPKESARAMADRMGIEPPPEAEQEAAIARETGVMPPAPEEEPL